MAGSYLRRVTSRTQQISPDYKNHKLIRADGWAVGGVRSMILSIPALLMHADAGGLRAFVSTGSAAVKLAVAEHAFTGLDLALAAVAGTFEGLGHKRPCFSIFACELAGSTGNVNCLS